jgi:hypothetical protein
VVAIRRHEVHPAVVQSQALDATASPGDVLVHDETNAVLARLLVDLKLPVALGVLYRQPAQSFEAAFYAHHPTGMRRTRSVADFIKGPNSWTVT